MNWLTSLLASCGVPEAQVPALETARSALARGLAAENRLRALLEQGHADPQLAAYLGQAELYPPAIRALAQMSEDDALVARLERKLAGLTTR